MDRKKNRIRQEFSAAVLENTKDAILQGIANSYFALYLINLETMQFEMLSALPLIDKVVSQYQDPQEALIKAMEKLILPAFHKEMRTFLDLSTLSQRLQGKTMVSIDYKGIAYGWSNAKFLPVSFDARGELKEVLYAIEHIQERKSETQIYKEALESNADFIYHFDLTEGIVRDEISGMEKKLIPTLLDITLPLHFDVFVKQYFSAIGYEPIKGYEKIYTTSEMMALYEAGITRFRSEYYSGKFNRYYCSEFYLTKNESNKHITVMVVRSDITEDYRKKLEQQNTLKNAQEAEAIANSMLMAFAEPYLNVYIVDFSKDLVTIVKQDGFRPPNQSWLSDRQVVYTPSIEAYIQSRVVEEDKDYVRAQMRKETVEQNLAGKSNYSFAYHVHENGEPHDFECRIIRTEKDSVYVFGFTNIDALLAEEKSQKELYRNALDSMKQSEIYLEAISTSYDFLVITNLSQNTFTCPVSSTKMGWSCAESGSYEELIGRMIRYFPEEIRQSQRNNRTIAKQFERFQNGERYWEDRHVMYDTDGNPHWLNERVMYTRDKESGDLIGVSVVSIIDEAVRSAKRAEQITTALSRDYTNVYLIKPWADEVSPVVLNGYITKGLNRSIGSVSPYWQIVENYAAARVLKDERERFRMLLSPENIQNALADKEEIVYSYRIMAEGNIHDYQIKIIKTAEEGTYIFGFKNIDALMVEQKKRQQKYEAALAEATRANQAKTEFLSRMSHDIRTPINGIVGMTYIMEKQIDDKEQIEDGIQKIKLLTGQLEMLINDVLEMSRIESGKIELTRESFDLQAKLSELQPAIAVMADNMDIRMEGAHYSIQHPVVISSPIHIQRIASNILTNSIKYNRSGGTVECWLTERAIDAQHSMYEFKIQDTGIGMSEKFLKHIFEPFSRERETHVTSYSGTGLGMAITKELLDLLGGTIEIESEVNVGTTVIFRIPLEIGETAAECMRDMHEASLAGKRVLLVEDNKVNLKFAHFLLEEEDAEVDTAMNGQEAVDRFAAAPVGGYDLILMDVMMPVMDGLQATRCIRSMEREDAKTVPILAMSANAFQEDVARCLDAGMSGHIAKPLDIEAMKLKIAEFI